MGTVVLVAVAVAVLLGLALMAYLNHRADPLPDYADPDVEETRLEEYL